MCFFLKVKWVDNGRAARWPFPFCFFLKNYWVDNGRAGRRPFSTLLFLIKAWCPFIGAPASLLYVVPPAPPGRRPGWAHRSPNTGSRWCCPPAPRCLPPPGLQAHKEASAGENGKQTREQAQEQHSITSQPASQPANSSANQPAGQPTRQSDDLGATIPGVSRRKASAPSSPRGQPPRRILKIYFSRIIFFGSHIGRQPACGEKVYAIID